MFNSSEPKNLLSKAKRQKMKASYFEGGGKCPETRKERAAEPEKGEKDNPRGLCEESNSANTWVPLL